MSDKTTELNEYLSDEELLSLIEDTEKNMTAVAPQTVLLKGRIRRGCSDRDHNRGTVRNIKAKA